MSIRKICQKILVMQPLKLQKVQLLPELMKVGEVGYSVVRVDDKRPVEPPNLKKS